MAPEGRDPAVLNFGLITEMNSDKAEPASCALAWLDLFSFIYNSINCGIITKCCFRLEFTNLMVLNCDFISFNFVFYSGGKIPFSTIIGLKNVICSACPR